MTTYTQTQVVVFALIRSGLLGDDETPTADQLAISTAIYRSRLASLQARGMKLWNWTPDAVPEELLDPLADYMALFILPASGGQRPPDEAIIQSEHTLRALCAVEPTGDVIEATYY